MAKAALEERIRADLQQAVRTKDTLVLNILSLLVTSLDNASIAKNREALTADEVERVTNKLAKEVEESISIYDKAGRKDLLAEEQAQLKILKRYLPEAMSNEELEQIVKNTITSLKVSGPQAMGQVMGKVREQVGNRADGAVIAAMVREQLQ